MDRLANSSRAGDGRVGIGHGTSFQRPHFARLDYRFSVAVRRSDKIRFSMEGDSHVCICTKIRTNFVQCLFVVHIIGCRVSRNQDQNLVRQDSIFEIGDNRRLPSPTSGFFGQMYVERVHCAWISGAHHSPAGVHPSANGNRPTPEKPRLERYQ
jgi:hypothetical protein